MSLLQKILAFIGRAAFSAIFLVSGFNKILDWQKAEESLTEVIVNALLFYQNVPWIDEILEFASKSAPMVLMGIVAVEILAGLMLFLGSYIRIGSLLLFLYYGVMLVLQHHFWDLQGGERMMQIDLFIKGASVCGVLLLLLAYGNPLKNPPKKSPATKKNED